MFEKICCTETKSKVNRDFSFLIGGQNPYKTITNNFFFHHSEFFVNHKPISFYILDNIREACVGSFHVTIQREVGYSPLKAPFGSIDISNSIPPSVLTEFLDVAVQWCKQKHISALIIKHYPNCYDPDGSVLVQNALLINGFKINQSDTAQYISLHSVPHVFNRSARIKINKCKKAGFKFSKLEITEIKEVYDLIKNCKDRKGYPTNMTLEDLKDIISRFPERYLLFGVRNGEVLICASICVVVNQKILYDFSHGHCWEFRRYSPVNFLVEGIYNFCIENNFKILDLGLSTSNSVLNIGLFNFKKRLGAQPSTKFSYLRNL